MHSITREQLENLHTVATKAVMDQYGTLEDKGGCCGFAWVNVHGRLKKDDKMALQSVGFKHNDYEKCQQLWATVGGQSIDMKETYAHAYAVELKNLGFTAYSGSRMD